MAILRRQMANFYIVFESLLSTKHGEAGLCGLKTKFIYNTCPKKPGWISKVVNNHQKEKPFESLLSNQGEKSRGAP